MSLFLTFFVWLGCILFHSVVFFVWSSLEDVLQIWTVCWSLFRVKVQAPRHEHIRQEKIVETSEASGDDLRLSMQPPRASSRSPPWLQQSTKPEASQRPVKKHQPYRPSQINTGVGMRGISHLGACAERAERTDRTLVVPPRENNVAGSSQLDQPAADEGSRTGLKHSVLAGLLDNAGLLHHDRTAPYPAGSSGCPPLAPQHQKSQNQNGGSESMIPLRWITQS